MARSGAGREEDAASFDMMPPHQGLGVQVSGTQKKRSDRTNGLGVLLLRKSREYM